MSVDHVPSDQLNKEKNNVPITQTSLGSDGGIQVRADDEVTQRSLKTIGSIILIPQPSDDPKDPLNWTWGKKHLVLLSLFLPALLSDFGMTWGHYAIKTTSDYYNLTSTGTTLFQVQAPTFRMSIPHVAQSISGGIFLQGPGGVFAVPFAQRYGRLPVLFWSQFVTCILVIGASQAKSYAGFTACRTLQGWFNTSPQVIGLSIVGDMFFFHERTKKINMWAFSFIVGPFLAPFCSAFLNEVIDWRASFGVLAALYALSTIILVLAGDETLYDRGNPTTRQRGVIGKVKLLIGVTGFQEASKTTRPTLLSVSKRLLRLGLYPNVFAVTAGFFMILFMWAIGIVTTVSQFLLARPYSFGPTPFALFYLGPVIGAIVGELWGHFFNELLRKQYMKRHHGHFVPEHRLWGTYLAVVTGVAGLVLFGETVQHALTWFGLCFGFAMYTFAMVSGTTAVSAYLLDSYTRDGGLVSGVLNFWRTTGGFCVTYFQLKWVARNGAAVSFGVQAALLAASFLTVVVTQIWGRRWRLKQ